MYTRQKAFLEFHELTRDLGERSEAQQVLLLKRALLRTLERAADLTERSEALGEGLDRARAEAIERAREHQAFAAELHRQLTGASRELATTRADGEAEVRALRLEVLRLEDQRQSLEEICRSLLLTIEDAAMRSRAGSDPPPEAYASA